MAELSAHVPPPQHENIISKKLKNKSSNRQKRTYILKPEAQNRGTP